MRPFLKESGWRSEVEKVIRCECYANLHGQPKISSSSLDYFEKKKRLVTISFVQVYFSSETSKEASFVTLHPNFC